MRFSSTSFVSLVTCTAVSGFVAATAQASGGKHSATSSSSEQQSTITIARQNLVGSDLLLKVAGSGNAQIKGFIKVNGKFMANLQDTRSINLTSCLSRSTCEIDITGTYNPSSVVQIELYSTNQNMKSKLESSGSGILKQKLVLNIN